MNISKNRILALLLALVMILTSFPMTIFAASPTNRKTEITNITEHNGKQIVELTKLRGERKPQILKWGASLFSTGAEKAADETIQQKITINLETLGLNIGEDTFDSTALDEALPFDVTIKLEDPVSKNVAQSETVTFYKGETTKTITFFVPKRLGQAKVSAELTALDSNINLRVYKSGDSTTETIGKDLSFDFLISQIVHPVIKLKVTDPYGKELNENIAQELGLKLKLGDEGYDFNLPASTKYLNIRTLETFKGDGVFLLNQAGDKQSLELTTQLDENKRLKVGEKNYKLKKITYNALGQEVEIENKKEKIGGYIEFATQPKIIVPTPDENGDIPKTPDGYKRLSFYAESSANAQDGKFKNGEKLKVIDVLEGTEYTDGDLQKEIKNIGQPTPIINGRIDDNKKFLKWNPELPTTGPVADTDYYPVYLANGDEITPGEKLPDGVFEVKVIKDDTIAADVLYGKTYAVFDGSTLARDKFPDLKAAKFYDEPKWTATPEGEQTADEAKPWARVIHKNTEFKATAKQLPDIIENPIKPTPDGYVRVTFVAGKGVEDFKDAKTYDVKEGIALTKEQYPTAKAKVGYKDPKWDVVPGTPITKHNATITATATKEKDIIPGGPGVIKPEGYYIVEFLEGKHGEFKPVNEKAQVTVYYVNPEAKVKMSQITAPTVTANVGYKFDSWSKEYQADTIITGDRQITAVYIYVDGVSTVKKDGWTKVTLKSGDKGQFTKTTNEGTTEFDDLVYYVDPLREVTIPAPVVKATVGYTFTGFDKPLTGTFKTETVITAKYLSTSDVIEDKTPGDDDEKPDGYVTVRFDAGQNGTFAPNSVTKFFVNPNKDVEIGAPGIEPNKNFVFKGFFNGNEEHSSAAKKYAKDVTYTAKYEDKSNESIIPGDQPKPGGWVTISFSAGEHGTFELVNGEQPTIAYHVNPEKDVVLKEKAPKVKANDGYTFTKYDPDVNVARKYKTEGQVITAQYEKNVIEVTNPDSPIKEGYIRVSFKAGEGVEAFTDAKTYDVRKGSALTEEQYPTVVVKKDYDTASWSIAPGTVINDQTKGVSENKLTITASAQLLIRPVDPNSPGEIPEGYTRVTLKKDDTSIEDFAADTKTIYDVKQNAGIRLGDVSKKVTPAAKEGYKNPIWYEGENKADLLKEVTGDKTNNTITLTAKAEKANGIIPVDNPDDPVKEGYTRITLKKGDLVDSITGKVAYDVKNDGSVRYGDLIDEITKDKSLTTINKSDNGRDPLVWKDKNQAEIKREAAPGKTAETITVSATKLDKDAYEPTPVEQTVKQKEVPNAKDSISNKDDLPKGTTFEFVDDKGKAEKPDTNNVGTVNTKVKVTYPDKTSEIVDATIKVVPKDSIIENPTGPKPPEGYARVTLAKDATVKTLGDNAVTVYDVRIKDGIRLGDITKKVNPVASEGHKNPTWYEGANADKKSDLLDKITANITLTAKAEQDQASLIDPQPFEQKVEKGKKADPKKSILDPDKLPAGTKFEYVDSNGDVTEPKTDTVGKVDVTVKVTYPDGSSDLVKTKIDVVENINIIPVDPKNPGDVPDGYVRVTLTNDTASVKDYKQIYDVLADGTVRYGDVLNQAPAATPEVGYKEPITWKNGKVEVNKFDKVTGDKTTPITLTAYATKNEDIIENPTGPTPEGYVRVKLTNDPTSVKAYNKVLDVRSGVVTYEQVIAKASGVEPAVGYKEPITWKKDGSEVNKPSKVTGDKDNPITLKAFATKNEDVIENPTGPTPPEGYVRVTFVNDKTSVKTYKKVMDIKSGSKNYAELLTHATGVEPAAGYKKPITWMNGKATIDEEALVTGDKTTPITLTAYATENDDIIENPTGPTPEGYVRVKLVNGDASVKEYKKILDVKNDKVTYQQAIDKASDIEPAVGYKLPITWKKDDNEINLSVKIKGSNDVIITLKAYATENGDIIEDPTDPTPEGYVRVIFVNDKTSVKTYKKEIDVKSGSKTYAELLTKVKGVEPAVGYKLPITWKNGVNAIVEENKVTGDKDHPITLTAYATKNEDIVEVDDPSKPIPEGYVRVTLKNDPTTVKTYKKILDVLADGSKRYGDILAKATGVEPADGYKLPITWKNDKNAEVDKLAKVTGDKEHPITLTAYASENANIIEDPTKPTPKGYVRVKLVNDKTSVKPFEKILDVKSNTETYATVVAKAKNVEPAVGYKLPITWKKGDAEIVLTANVIGTHETIITLTAYATKNADIIENPTGPTPEGYVRVIFVNGSGIKDFKTKLTYDVKIGTALPEDKYPQVELEAGYENLVWSTPAGTPITADNNIIRASATSSTNVIPVEPGTDKPAGYVTVTFKADETKGSLDGVEAYYVNPKVAVKLNAPKVKPVTGYEFTQWDKNPTKETLYEKDTDITAQFKDLPDKIEAKDGVKKPEGYVEIRFAVDAKKATTEGTTKYFVNPNKDVELTAPTVTVTDSKYTFNDKWDKEFSGSKKYDKDLTITAVFESSKVEAPVVDNVVTGDTTVNVNPGDADKVTVEVEGQGKVVVEKDPNGTWKTPDGTVITPDDGRTKPENKGKLSIPVKALTEKALVEVTVEKDGVASEKVAKTAKKQVSATVASLGAESSIITVRTYPAGATVTLFQGEKEIDSVVSNILGVANIQLKEKTKLGQYYTIKVTMDGYEPYTQTFKVE